MRIINKLTARLFPSLLVVCGAAAVCAAQALPSVAKVEPPDWWASHSVNPVRVMLRGRNLGGARVEAVGQGIKAGLVRVNESGTYAFVDVHIDRGARPGARQLRVRTAAGAADANFSVAEPLPREGRFRGFTPDDVIYFI